jgi:outer membrane lipoprotein-sorting protein
VGSRARSLFAAAAGALGLALSAAAAPTVAADPQLEALLARFSRAQATTTTMSATFRQVKEDDLLAEPSIQSGRMYYSQPSDFRWEYEDPERLIIVATPDRIQRWIPGENLVREADATRRQRLFSYFGIGSDIEVLRKHFNITLQASDSSHPSADKIQLVGKRKRVQKRIERLEMWIDRATSLPAVIRIVMADGGSTAWEFSDIRVNPPTPPDLYKLRVPRGTRVVRDDGRAPGPVLEDLEEPETGEAAAAAPTRDAHL